MRNPARALDQIPGSRRVGAKLLAVLSALLVACPGELAMMTSLGSDACEGFSSTLIERARHECANVLDFQYSFERGATPFTTLRPDFIERFAHCSGDPEAHLAQWCREGCPLGIRQELSSCGIFPRVSEREALAEEAECLQSDAQTFQNYASLDEHPEAAWEQVSRLEAEGFVQGFATIQQATAALNGESPVLSKLALISKQRSDGSWKHRLIGV